MSRTTPLQATEARFSERTRISGGTSVPAGGHLPLAALFFLSGWAAILYQIVWQRTLFAVVGINIEAVTLIVAEFMLGLGIGSLVGGRLSRAAPNASLRWFAVIELAIAAFGAISLPLLRTAGEWAVAAPALLGALGMFLLLAVPTLGMGATLPLLVNHRVGLSGNVGWSVGSLYFVNTLGSAVAAFVAVAGLMGALGQQAVVWLAVGCNLAVAFFALLLHARRGHP